MNAFDVVVYSFALFGAVALVAIIAIGCMFNYYLRDDDSDYAPPPKAGAQ